MNSNSSIATRKTTTPLSHILSSTVLEHLLAETQTLTDHILHPSSLTVQHFNLLKASKPQTNWITHIHHLFQSLDLPQSWILECRDAEKKICNEASNNGCNVPPRHVKIFFISDHIKNIVHQALINHLEETNQPHVFVLNSTPKM